MIMIDPKIVELSVYNVIPHLLIPVVTDPKKAAGAFAWAVQEMENRYAMFAAKGVRDLAGYNEKISKEDEQIGKLPHIVIIVDELADLMMVAKGEVEDSIVRLTQLARAAGIHLVIATQRPSVDVITGLIKANMPSRIAFAVTSQVDSRTILDMAGAEKLIGKGDMLFYPQNYQKPARIQGAFVSDDDVQKVVSYIKENNAADSSSMAAIESEIDGIASSDGSGQNADLKGDSIYDEYFAEAGRFIIDKNKASIGMLQRVFKIGFNRAARIMDQLAEAGVVSEENGTRARQVLMDMPTFEQYLEDM
jgi:S-DNA-T family DNA segregation ATPase FtsK/SpoIIIE